MPFSSSEIGKTFQLPTMPKTIKAIVETNKNLAPLNAMLLTLLVYVSQKFDIL